MQHREEGENILIAQQKPDGSFVNVEGFGRAHTSWLDSDMPYATYVNVSSVRAPGEGGRWRRRKSDCVAAFMLVFDDVGTKVDEANILVEPTYKLETSAGNFQWGYMLVPDEKLTRFEGLVNALAEKGLTDPGAEGCNRVVRIPGSRNLKPGRNNFVSRLTVWEPAREWTLDDLANAFGVDMLQVRFKSIVNEANVTDAELQNPVHDPLLVWLTDNGHVIEDRGTEWIDVRCPWHEEHSAGGEDIAGYSPLGRGEPSRGWAERRSFKCQHEHCKDRYFREFMDWGTAHGAPIVPGHDLLPFLQSRYTYVGDEKKVADMIQRIPGGTWLWELEAWSMMHYHRVDVAGYDRPVLIKKAYLASEDTTKVATTRYLPGQARTRSRLLTTRTW